MKPLAIIVISVGTVLCWVQLSAAEKSHSLSITRAETPISNEKWIKIHYGELKKMDKNTKILSGNLTLFNTLNGDNIMCEVKIYQKTGGKYLKAPVDIPKRPLCEHMEKNEVVWPCIQRHTNLPERCPIPAGEYWIKDMDPNDCDFGQNLPPNMAEDYRVEGYLWEGVKPIISVAGFGKLKRRMSVAPKIPRKF